MKIRFRSLYNFLSESKNIQFLSSIVDDSLPLETKICVFDSGNSSICDIFLSFILFVLFIYLFVRFAAAVVDCFVFFFMILYFTFMHQKHG